MSGVSVSINVHTADGGFTQSLWIVGADAVERIREQLGEPACEIVADGSAVTAMEHAGDADGGVVVLMGDES